ncbi:MAG: deoxyuridine 5'-triphosphate nucleotidohydrolase, partial [Clostridiales bacterium]|nr:deoxyuridine 5'-triphosphate nucleotidohydrolase [Clostridiales bacterium]
MLQIAQFYKVSKERFIKDYTESFPNSNEYAATMVYDLIKLPKRATIGSAGYDFYTPIDINLK